MARSGAGRAKVVVATALVTLVATVAHNFVRGEKKLEERVEPAMDHGQRRPC